MWRGSRRRFLQTAGAALAAGAAWPRITGGGEPGQAGASGVQVLHPRWRVPASFFIDDSTCLVNMGRFCMPQFAAARPDRDIYNKPWRTWPAEIPDAFLREFGEWCAEQGVRGKFSIVPYPACVGWLDRELPGWSRSELLASLKLVRELMAPNWDIHPEMITHTRVIDIKTGRPMAELSSATMENSYPQEKKSVDELAAYMAYALRILRNCELPCEGITTPGGFGNLVKSELSLAVRQAVQDVFGAELPHYFKYISSGDAEETAPKLEHLTGEGGDDVQLTVNVPAGTGDWMGGWDGDRPPEPELYANEDASQGRMAQLIEREQPAVMFCHWPGLYNHGAKTGFAALKKVVLAVQARFGERILWMKCSELARYWAARQLTRIERAGDGLVLDAPFACPRFTLRLPGRLASPPTLKAGEAMEALSRASGRAALDAGRWLPRGDDAIVCFDLPKGRSCITLA